MLGFFKRLSKKDTPTKMGHATATFNGKTIAETDAYVFVEGNVYGRRESDAYFLLQFPPSSVDQSVFTPSTNTTVCPWKGTASYYNISVEGQEAKDAAWYYPDTITDKAAPLKDHVAFCKLI
ncbi:MAG: hypothetical protein Q9166_004670 [cf. Caloplaca sp. 2 TL-2023]